MSLIFKGLKAREWVAAAICLVLVACQVWLDLRLPDYMSEITMIVQTEGSVSEVWSAGGSMLVCALASMCASIAVGFLAARVAAAFSMRLRSQVFRKVESFSMEEIGRFSTASLITRSTNDITQVQMLIAMGLQVVLKAPLMAVWAICKIAGKNWQWSLATGCAVFVLILIVAVLLVFAFPKFQIVQYQTDRLNAVTRENLTGVRVVRAYNSEAYQERKFEKANEELTATNLFVNRMMAIMQPGMQCIMNGLSLAIYWIGAYLINSAVMADKALLFSDMVVYSSYAMQVVMSFMMLVMIFVMAPRAMVCARRVLEVVNTVPTIVDGPLALAPGEAEEVRGEVEFRGVSFRYPDAEEDVLHEVSFTAHAGETVAFIGSTGSGKSTVVNLIPRFYDATEGEILIDGRNIREYPLKTLRAKIGYVPQRAVMFKGSVASNIAFGDCGREQPSAEEIERAAQIAQAADFIDKLEQGYDSHVAQGGTNLSGGQKQRVAIARAICRAPEFFIFDDSFSALDYKTDKTLRQELKKSTSGATVFIVAQRIGTIREADRIVVLDEGSVVGIGRHEELLRSCPVYREIAQSQLSEEELKTEEAAKNA